MIAEFLLKNVFSLGLALVTLISIFTGMRFSIKSLREDHDSLEQEFRGYVSDQKTDQAHRQQQLENSIHEMKVDVKRIRTDQEQLRNDHIRIFTEQSNWREYSSESLARIERSVGDLAKRIDSK